MLLPRPLWGSELDSKARQGTGRRSESQLSLQFFSGGRGRTHTHTGDRRPSGSWEGAQKNHAAAPGLQELGESEVTSRDSKGSKVNTCSAADQEGPRASPRVFRVMGLPGKLLTTRLRLSEKVFLTAAPPPF